MMKLSLIITLLLLGSSITAEETKTYEKYNNKTCPVMGGPVNPDVSIVYEEKKIYFCCPGCDRRFLKNPEKYLAILEEQQKVEEEDEW